MRFSGETYDHERDGTRLSKQYVRVFELMRDGAWRTLEQISSLTGDPPASISARLRDMRKERFGSHKVNREYIEDGLFTYQLEVRAAPEPPQPAAIPASPADLFRRSQLAFSNQQAARNEP